MIKLNENREKLKTPIHIELKNGEIEAVYCKKDSLEDVFFINEDGSEFCVTEIFTQDKFNEGE